jgi:GT2 family glycosyltransferase
LQLWYERPSELPLTSIVLVTYNKVELTKRCLESVYARTRAPFEVIVVDNHSADDTVACLRSLGLPRLEVVTNDVNLGFGAGCNLGAARARGELLMFLNNDTLVCPGWLERMIDKLLAHGRLGMVGPMTNVASNAQLLPAGYSPRSEDYERVAAALARREAGRIEPLRRVIGFCMLLRRALFDELGRFDQAFGVGHYEDDDLSLRLERAGWLAAAARDVYVYHFAGQSFVGAGIDRLRNARDRAFLFYQKWGNDYLDWPDLGTNLQDAVQVVLPFDPTGGYPRWRPGDPCFLVTAVAPKAGPDVQAKLAAAHRESRLLDYLAGHDLPLGEAYAAAVRGHDAAGHLLLDEAANPAAMLAWLTEHVPDADAAVLWQVGYFARRATWAKVGPLAPRRASLSELCREHAARAAAAGLAVAWLEAGPRGWQPAAATVLRAHVPRLRRSLGSGLLALRGHEGRWLRAPRRSAHPAARVVNITMLSYGRLDFTKQSVASVRRHTRFPHLLVVVDNGSAPEVVEWLKQARRSGDIDILLLNDRNLGVAAAANQGWRACETAYYLKLDSDIVIEKDGWLEALVETADAVQDAGMVGYSFEGTSYPLKVVDGVRVRPAPSLGGACVLLPRRGHDAAGFWCEDYFPYSEEDLDMCFRLRLAGLRSYYLEDEHVGAHLPRGRATPLGELRALDDEDDAAYRAYKDEARVRHVGSTLWVNMRLYRHGHKPLYCAPGRQPAARERLFGGLYGLVPRLHNLLSRRAR